jgi:hypothetical protein
MGKSSFPNNDARATSMADTFELSMQPGQFPTIPAALKKPRCMRENRLDETTR